MTGIEKMQIDPNQLFVQFTPNQPADGSAKDQPPARRTADRIELNNGYEKFIRLATENEQTRSQTIAEAQKALKDGSLDTPEAARLAAESLLRFGI